MGKQLTLVIDSLDEALPKYAQAVVGKDGLGVGAVFIIQGGRSAKIGSGKTTLAKRLMETLDPHPDPARYTHTPGAFIEAIRTAPPESVVVLDESEYSIASIKYWDTTVQALGWVMMTFRERRIIAIVVTPLADVINKNVRKLCRLRFIPRLVVERVGANRKVVKACYCRVQRIVTDDDGEKPYYPYLKFYLRPKHRLVYLKEFKVTYPQNKPLSDAIDVADHNFKEALLVTLQKSIKRQELIQGIRDIEIDKDYKGMATKFIAEKEIAVLLARKGRVTADDLHAFNAAQPQENQVTLGQTAGNVVAKIITNAYRQQVEKIRSAASGGKT